jgi:hypothetical protein
MDFGNGLNGASDVLRAVAAGHAFDEKVGLYCHLIHNLFITLAPENLHLEFPVHFAKCMVQYANFVKSLLKEFLYFQHFEGFKVKIHWHVYCQKKSFNCRLGMSEVTGMLDFETFNEW